MLFYLNDFCLNDSESGQKHIYGREHQLHCLYRVYEKKVYSWKILAKLTSA